MGYAEDLVRLRKRMLEALEFGVVNESSKELYEATLIQIMNETERQRQACMTRAEELRRQAAIADGQAHAFSQVNNIVYNILSGYVQAAEKQKQEEVAYAAEMAEKEARIAAAAEGETTEVKTVVSENHVEIPVEVPAGVSSRVIAPEEVNRRRKK